MLGRYSIIYGSCYWFHEGFYKAYLKLTIVSQTTIPSLCGLTTYLNLFEMFWFVNKVYIQLPLLYYSKPILMTPLAAELINGDIWWSVSCFFCPTLWFKEHTDSDPQRMNPYIVGKPMAIRPKGHICLKFPEHMCMCSWMYCLHITGCYTSTTLRTKSHLCKHKIFQLRVKFGHHIQFFKRANLC